MHILPALGFSPCSFDILIIPVSIFLDFSSEWARSEYSNGEKHTHFSSHFSSFFWQVERKRHIGNDIVNIIFIDGDSCDFSPNCIKSQFTRILFINWFFLRLQLHVFSYFLFIEKKKRCFLCYDNGEKIDDLTMTNHFAKCNPNSSLLFEQCAPLSKICHWLKFPRVIQRPTHAWWISWIQFANMLKLSI